MTQSLTEALRAAALANPAAPAMVAPGQVIRYGPLLRLVNAAVGMLREQGVHPAQTVGLSMDTTPVHVLMLLATAAMGVTTVPLNLLASVDSRARLARKFGLSCLIADSQAYAVQGLRTVLVGSVSASGTTPPLETGADAETPVRVLLTSGTMGESKGVLRNQRNVMEIVDLAAPHFSSSARLLQADLHSSIGYHSALIVLCRGGCLVFPPRGDLLTQIDTVAQHAVTHLILSPLAARQMLAQLPSRGLAFPSLRSLRLVGGAPGALLTHDLMQRMTTEVYSPYALTELATVTALTPEELRADPSRMGRALPGVELRIVDANGGPLPEGKRGEILIRRPAMPREYLNDPERTRERFRDGWFHTGDTGYLAANGMLHVEGRLDDLINVGGHKLLPSQAEDFLMQHPQVRDAAVFMAGEGELAQLTAAVVSDTASLGDLDRYCVPLGVHAPARFLRVAEIPRNASGKIRRPELARLLE